MLEWLGCIIRRRQGDGTSFIKIDDGSYIKIDAKFYQLLFTYVGHSVIFFILEHKPRN